MQSSHSVTATLLLLAMFSSASAQTNTAQTDSAQAEQQTRVGTCADARSQMEYFCGESDANKNDPMIGFGTACSNAKKNVMEACEGVVEPDVEYKFDKQ